MASTAAAIAQQPAIRFYQPEREPSFNYSMFDMFLYDFRDRAETTTKGYKTCIDRFKNWLIDNEITRPTRDDIVDYENFLKSSDLTVGTQAQYLRAVKHFFNWTAARGLYPNITDNLQGIKIRHDTHRRDALNRDDVRRVAASIDRTTETGKRNFAIFMIDITCGLRCIEVSRANIGDLKTIGGKTYLYVWGKGHEEPDTPVEIIPQVKTALDDYLNARTTPTDAKSPLFASTSNNNKGKRIKPQTISTMIKKILVDAGYNSDKITAHSLRHSSATACYKTTGDIVLTQKHQRHSDINTTMIYVHEAERETRDDEQKVYNYFFDSEKTSDDRQEALQLIDEINPDKLPDVIETLKKFL